MGLRIVTVVGSVVRAIGIVWSIGVVTVRGVIPPRVAQPDPDSETEVVRAAKVVMVTEVVRAAEMVRATEVMGPRVAEAMEGVAAMMAAEVASMPTTEMPMSTDVPAAMSTMPATGEGDRPTDHQHDDEDNRPENRPAFHGKPPTKG
jgi:hypothetical protein